MTINLNEAVSELTRIANEDCWSVFDEPITFGDNKAQKIQDQLRVVKREFSKLPTQVKARLEQKLEALISKAIQTDFKLK